MRTGRSLSASSLPLRSVRFYYGGGRAGRVPSAAERATIADGLALRRAYRTWPLLGARRRLLPTDRRFRLRAPGDRHHQILAVQTRRDPSTNVDRLVGHLALGTRGGTCVIPRALSPIWHSGEPTEPGLYWVCGHPCGGAGLRPIGVLVVTRGPRGGVRVPRWLCPPRGEQHWLAGWCWARAEVPN